MPVLFVFLLKVNIALLLFCAGYYLVLRHLTFYTLNRIYLVAAIVFASAYPQINLSDFLQRHQQLAKPVNAVAVNWQAPAENFIKPLAQPGYWYWAEVIFWTGAVLLALRLLMQLAALYKLYSGSRPAKLYGHNVRLIDNDAGPFSFWKSIYVNPAKHGPADLEAILLHEQVHVSEWHTLDILLAELSTVFYWFNPGVWLIKKAVRENIEFITDRKILNNGIDTKQYQYSLVNVSFAVTSPGLVNHFNVSTIKKRIIMMNAKRSSKLNLTRYAFLMPAVVSLLLVFSISKAAFVNKVTHAIKTSALNKANFENRSFVHNSATKAAIVHLTAKTVLTDPAITAKTSAAKIKDTLKNGGITVVGTSHADTLNYVINGKKSNKADFKALDPDQIYAIEVLSAEQAKKIFSELDNSHNVLFVTTDDSEAGKKFKEKIDDLNNGSYVLASKLSAFNIRGLDSNYTITGKPEVWENKVPKHKYHVGSLKKSQSITNVDGKWVVTENAPVTIQYTTSDSVKVYGTLTPGKPMIAAVPAKGFVTLKAPVYTINGFSKYRNNYTPKGVVITRPFSNWETNIESFSDKLIIIDGKVASDRQLKKLSVADIKSISINNSEETAKKYGDKAKNGVVTIYTKKAAK